MTRDQVESVIRSQRPGWRLAEGAQIDASLNSHMVKIVPVSGRFLPGRQGLTVVVSQGRIVGSQG